MREESLQRSLVSPHTAIKTSSLSLFPPFGLVFVRLQQNSTSESRIRGGEKAEESKDVELSSRMAINQRKIRITET